MTTLDYIIKYYNESRSTLKCLSHCLQIQKSKSNNLNKRIQELTLENKYLQKELIYYKDIHAILMKFFDNVNDSI